MKRVLCIPLSCALWACGDDPVGSDAGDATSFDQGPLDASFDAEPADLVINSDGGSPDSGADAGPLDGGDSGVIPDAGVCPAIAQTEVCTALAPAIGAHLFRCAPAGALLESEAEEIGLQFCLNAGLGGPSVAYRADRAGQCGCDLETLACGDSFDALGSCRNILAGDVPVGGDCDQSACDTDLACDACQTCIAAGARDAPCIDGRCEVDAFCDTTPAEPTCRAKPRVGEGCGLAACQGELDPFIYESTYCAFENGRDTCQLLAEVGEDCFVTPCHPLLTCTSTNTCVTKPSRNQPCELAIDVADPSSLQRVVLITEAQAACRLSARLFPLGDYCVQTGATSGQGTCVSLPKAGGACGIGAQLSARCERGSYCSAIDPTNLVPVSGSCTAGVTEGQACDLGWNATLLGSQCQTGLECRPVGQAGECWPEEICI